MTCKRIQAYHADLPSVKRQPAASQTCPRRAPVVIIREAAGGKPPLNLEPGRGMGLATEKRRREGRVVLGGLMVLTAALMFAGVGALVKLASRTLPTEMNVFARNAVALAFFVPWLLARHEWRGLQTTRLRFHLVRSASGLGAMYCFYYALKTLPLADAVLLHYTAPVFIPLLARWWLKEPVAPRVRTAVAVGFLGIVLILKPGFGLFQPAGLVGLASGLLSALAMTAIRRMSATEPTVRIIFYFTVFSTISSSVPLAWAWKTPESGLYWVLAGMGALSIAAQFFVTRGYSLAPAGQLGPFSYGNVLFAALLGWLLWGESLDFLTGAGALLTCLAGIIASHPVEPKWELAAAPGRDGGPRRRG